MQEVNRSSDSLQDATADSPFCIVSVNEKKVNIFLCSFLCCTDFYIICILFLFSSNTMYLPPHRLLEVGKILVDKKDFDNAIAWFKRAESILCNENGEAARLQLIMVRIQLIRVLEKVNSFNLSCKRELVLFQNSFSVETFQRGSWLLRRRPSQQPRRRISTRSVGIERTNSFQSRELH